MRGFGLSVTMAATVSAFEVEWQSVILDSVNYTSINSKETHSDKDNGLTLTTNWSSVEMTKETNKGYVLAMAF